jgi:DNA repair protein RadA/Sms
MSLVLGILTKQVHLRIAETDVFAAVAGGMALREPAGDLSLCLAIGSAFADTALDPQTVAIGEVGLGGEVRRVPGIERRLAEAARMGFATAMVPPGMWRTPAGMKLVPVADVRASFDAAWPKRPYMAVSGG